MLARPTLGPGPEKSRLLLCAKAGVRDRRAIVQVGGLPPHADIRGASEQHAESAVAHQNGLLKAEPPQSGGFCDIEAEGERFELSDDVAAVNGFRDLRDGLGYRKVLVGPAPGQAPELADRGRLINVAVKSRYPVRCLRGRSDGSKTGE